MLRGAHQPGAGVVRDAGCGPALQRCDQRVLREFLGKTDVAHHPRETGDEPRLLYPPDRVDRAMGVGSRHGYRLAQLHAPAQAEAWIEIMPWRPPGRAGALPAL